MPQGRLNYSISKKSMSYFSERANAIDMGAMVIERVDRLQKLDMETLYSLPEHSQETVSSGAKVTVSQYHEISEAGEHKLVVQALRPKWFGMFTAIKVEGFVVAKDGAKRPLTEQEKWAYL
jgi:hypothetical protein